VTNYLLDTNILILHFRNRPDITAMLADWQANGNLFISVTTRAEIFAGMHSHEEARTVALLDSLSGLPVDEAIADLAGRLIYRYARQGVQLSFPDAQIAATAIHHNLVLATTNAKHFPMPELQLKAVS
jgi:hypothetical protein